LASTPAFFAESTKSNNIEYGYNRALLAWYYVDPLFNNMVTNSNPYRNNTELVSNHLTRNVLSEEIFPNRETKIGESSRMTIMNLSFYPNGRGAYNVDVDGMGSDGKVTNPKNRWGGIMRKLDATDFETSNIEYIEFWMMDPFVNNKDAASTGGDLYFNLGDISEDILKDGKKSFENGLPFNGDTTKTETTVWGRVSKTQSTVNAFDNTPGARDKQDVGLDGLSKSNLLFCLDIPVACGRIFRCDAYGDNAVGLTSNQCSRFYGLNEKRIILDQMIRRRNDHGTIRISLRDKEGGQADGR